MLTISLDDALSARVQAAVARAKIADVNAFAVAAIKDALVKLEHDPQTAVPAAPNSQTGGAKPLAQFIDEQRIKHGLPDDWPNAEKYAMTDADWALMDDFVPEPDSIK